MGNKKFTNRPLTVDAVIIRNNKILFIQRGKQPFKNYWALPGGYVDWNETIDEAVVREVKEELNLDVENLVFVNYYSKPQRHPKQAINFAFLVIPKSFKFRIGDDAKAGKWFDLDKLPQMLAFDHNQIIKDAQAII